MVLDAVAEREELLEEAREAVGVVRDEQVELEKELEASRLQYRSIRQSDLPDVMEKSTSGAEFSGSKAKARGACAFRTAGESELIILNPIQPRGLYSTVSFRNAQQPSHIHPHI